MSWPICRIRIRNRIGIGIGIRVRVSSLLFMQHNVLADAPTDAVPSLENFFLLYPLFVLYFRFCVIFRFFFGVFYNFFHLVLYKRCV